METNVRVLILAKPGHFRDSLVAVLKTLPRMELFLVNGLSRDSWETLPHSQPTIALADLQPMDTGMAACLDSLKEKWPGVHCVALVGAFQQVGVVRPASVDYFLPRSASAGELLSTIRRFSAETHVPIRNAQASPASVLYGN